MQFLRGQNAFMRADIQAYGGYAIKTENDRFMVAFGSARPDVRGRSGRFERQAGRARVTLLLANNEPDEHPRLVVACDVADERVVPGR